MKQKRWTIGFAPLGEGQYQVTVRRSGSVHRFKAKLPPDISDLWTAETKSAEGTRQFRSGIESMSPESQFFGAGNMSTLKEVGERIMDATFGVGTGTEGIKMLGALEDRAFGEGAGVELQFDLSQTPELSGIPWEAAFLKSKDSFLAIGTKSNVVRRLDAQSDLPDPIERPIRILVTAANPNKDLNTGLELGNIERRVDELVAGGGTDFEVEAIHNTTRDQFRRKVMDWEPHVIHYIGHSAFKKGKGYLYFEKEKGDGGGADPVSAETLRNILLNKRPWVVVLNSCESGKTSQEFPMGGVAQDLLGRINIPFVVGMQQPVSDEAAIAFSQDFYGALTEGQSIANAVTLGRNAIATQANELTQIELITPALYTSGETDRIAFVETDALLTGAAVAAVAGATANGAGPVGGILTLLDSKLKIVSSIVGSIGAIIAGTLVVVSYMNRDGDAADDKKGGKDAVSAQSDEKPVDAQVADNAQNDGASPSIDLAPLAPRAVNSASMPPVDSFTDERGRLWVAQPTVQRATTTQAQNLSGEYGAVGSTGYSSPAPPPPYFTEYYYAENSQADSPPPLPNFTMAPAGAGDPAGIPTWSEFVGEMVIPYCSGVRERVPFARNDAKPDPDYVPSFVYWFHDCRVNDVLLAGHIEIAEFSPENVDLAAKRAETLKADWKDLAQLLPGGIDSEGRGTSEPVLPNWNGVSDPQDRRVDVVFHPICPVDSTFKEKISFEDGKADPDLVGMKQIEVLRATIPNDKFTFLWVTAGPARSGEDIYDQSDARIRSVLNAMPNMDGLNKIVPVPRIVDRECLGIAEDEPDFVAIQIAEPIVPDLVPDLLETDIGEQLDEAGVVSEGVEQGVAPSQD